MGSVETTLPCGPSAPTSSRFDAFSTYSDDDTRMLTLLGLDPNSKRPLQLFRWAACSNLNPFGSWGCTKGRRPFDQAQQPEARPVTHTSYRKSCLGRFEFDPGRSSAPEGCQFSALVATKSRVALFWPRSCSFLRDSATKSQTATGDVG